MRRPLLYACLPGLQRQTTSNFTPRSLQLYLRMQLSSVCWLLPQYYWQPVPLQSTPLWLVIATTLEGPADITYPNHRSEHQVKGGQKVKVASSSVRESDSVGSRKGARFGGTSSEGGGPVEIRIDIDTAIVARDVNNDESRSGKREADINGACLYAQASREEDNGGFEEDGRERVLLESLSEDWLWLNWNIWWWGPCLVVDGRWSLYESGMAPICVYTIRKILPAILGLMR